MILRKNSLNIKCVVLIFSQMGTYLLSETYLILQRVQCDITVNGHVFMLSTYYSSQILMKLEFSRQIFESLQMLILIFRHRASSI